MTAIPTLFKEVFLLKPELHKDTRGGFLEAFKKKAFEQRIGRKIDF